MDPKRIAGTIFLAMLAVGLGACGSTAPSFPAQGPRPGPTPVATATPTATPTPQPIPTAVPTVPPPAMLPTDDLQEPVIRVLLRRTSEKIVLPEPGRAWRLTIDGNHDWLWGPLTIGIGGPVSWSYQVAALSSQQAALDVCDSLKQALGNTVEVTSLAEEGGLYRVRVKWTSAQPGDPQSVLAAAGYPGAFAVSSGGRIAIDGQGGSLASEGEFLLEPAGEFPSAVGNRRYRGRYRVRPSGADQVLLINELNLERYLLGVVPAEMGPSVFPEVEALKAQSVAARTYAVSHLGDHDDEGYDICDTPACQVYSGAGAEHPLSTRAIEETSGMIAIFDGQPIDAMYTSTCGGHTEASSELFSGRAQPYLQGVPCAWERDLDLVSGNGDGMWLSATEFSAAVAQDVLKLKIGATPEGVVQAVATLLGTVIEPSALPDREDFARALIEAAGLTRSAEVLTPEASAVSRLLFLADLFKVPLDPPMAGAESSWARAAGLAVLEMRGVIERDRGEAVPRPDGVGIFPRRAMSSESLPAIVPLWERWREGYRQRSGQTVRPGVELERLRRGDQVVALVVRRSGGFGEADRRSAWREWVREKPWTELADRLGISDLDTLEVTRRTDFGRVVGLAAVGRSGRRKEWTGFDVRRALDLPETLFTAQVLTRPGGVKVARFLGRGWGHGVGLCQNGSYGLARSGMTFDRILSHYYSGITLVNWRR